MLRSTFIAILANHIVLTNTVACLGITRLSATVITVASLTCSVTGVSEKVLITEVTIISHCVEYTSVADTGDIITLWAGVEGVIIVSAVTRLTVIVGVGSIEIVYT